MIDIVILIDQYSIITPVHFADNNLIINIVVQKLFCINNFIYLYIHTNINTHINPCIHKYNCTYTCFFTSYLFELNENFDVDRRILKSDYIRFSPAETSTINTPNNQIYIIKPSEDSVSSLLFSYFDSNFKVIKELDSSRYANGYIIRLVNLGPIALFSNFILTTSSGTHLGDINHAQLVSLMYKVITSSKDNDDTSIGFHRSRNKR